MSNNRSYELLKALRKEAGMQVGPQPTGGAGGAGGKMPPGFLAGMNQKSEEEAAAEKEKTETQEAKALDDAAKQQDMQIKQVEMEQRIRDQNSQKMQEMQAEQARLQTEAEALKEQLKSKDTMHKEQLKHQNELVKAQITHQQNLDKQVESHKARMQTGFSSTLVSRSKSLRATIEKLHKSAKVVSPFTPFRINNAALSLFKSSSMYMPATPKATDGPATPKSMTSSKLTTGKTTADKTPLSVESDTPKPSTTAPATQTTAAPSPTPSASVLSSLGTKASPIATPSERMQSSWDSRAGNSYWDAAKNLRTDTNKAFDGYYKDVGDYKGTPGEGIMSGIAGRAGHYANLAFNKARQGVYNVGSHVVSTAAQGFGHAGEHFKDMGRRVDSAGDTYRKQMADQSAARQADQSALDAQWNKDMASGDKFNAAWNYFNSDKSSDGYFAKARDLKDRAWNFARDGIGGAIGAGGKGLLNTATATGETALSVLNPINKIPGAGAMLSTALSDPNEQSRGWDPSMTDAELASQPKTQSPTQNIASTISTIPNAAKFNNTGTNDLMRLQHTGYANQGMINSPMVNAVDPTTSALMPFTQTDGFSLDNGYQPNDMLSAFHSSPFANRGGYKDSYGALDNAFMSNRNMR